MCISGSFSLCANIERRPVSNYFYQLGTQLHFSNEKNQKALCLHSILVICSIWDSGVWLKITLSLHVCTATTQLIVMNIQENHSHLSTRYLHTHLSRESLQRPLYWIFHGLSSIGGHRYCTTKEVKVTGRTSTGRKMCVHILGLLYWWLIYESKYTTCLWKRPTNFQMSPRYGVMHVVCR